MLCSLLCCCCSVTKSCPTLWDPMDCSTPGFSVHHHLPRFAQTHVHQVSDTTQPSQPLLPPSPLALNLSQHQSLFQWISSLHQVTKVLELQLQHQSCQWIFISFRIDWFDHLVVQGTLKNLLQHHSLKALILRHSAFLMVQLSHRYLTIGKTIALTVRTFVGKGCLLFNTLSRFVIAILTKSKYRLIFWLQSLSAMILEPKKIKSVTVFTFFHLYLPWSDIRCHNHSFLNVVPSVLNVLSQLFHCPLSPWSLLKKEKVSLVPLRFMPWVWYHLYIWGCWYFFPQSWFQLVLHPVQHFSWSTLHIS